MKKRTKVKSRIFGFRTHTKWKMVSASIYYLVCFILIIAGLFIEPFSGEVSLSVIGIALLIPAILTSNFFIKRIIPILWHRRRDSDLIGFIIYLIIMLILALVFFTTPKEVKEDSISKSEMESTSSDITYEKDLTVHYIDVGQGDSTFVELPNGETILIDAGEKEYGSKVIGYINELGYEEITYLIATHPHSDHIGGLNVVVNEMAIDNIYMPKVVSNSSIYKDLLFNINDKGYNVNTAKKDVSIIDMDDLDVYFIAPFNEEYDDLNNYSAILKIDYKDISFLFMGDAEKQVEDKLEDDLSSDVIKVGHHGSDTSSSFNFVKKVNPSYAIISVGEDNIYNHPSNKIVKRWENIGAKVYRTDIDGNIKIVTNGYKLEVLTNN